MTGNELVAAVRVWMRRYVVVSPAQELVLALWCLHTWVYQQLSRTTPYLELTGVSGSGKTTVMETMMLLSRGSVLLNTLRSLAMARKITETEGHVSFFVDEAERLSSASFGDQRSMMASGYRKGGVHMISVGKETVMFEVFCPKAFTSTRTMADILHNRSIPLWIERGTPEGKLSQEYERAEATAEELKQQFIAVMKATPRIIAVQADWLHRERDQEIWTPLVSLAATLNLDKRTTEELVAASVDLSALRGIVRHCDSVVADAGAEERSYAVRLIQDVRACVVPGESFIPSRELVDRLRALPTGPWRSYQRSGLTEVTLAQLLGAFGLASTQARQKGKGRAVNAVRGWKVAEIQAAKF